MPIDLIVEAAGEKRFLAQPRRWISLLLAPIQSRELMPLYHFEVRTPTHVMLTEGVELPDHPAARVEAARRIGMLLTDHAGQLWADQDWQMDITDGVGLILYVIHVSAQKSAATRGSP